MSDNGQAAAAAVPGQATSSGQGGGNLLSGLTGKA